MLDTQNTPKTKSAFFCYFWQILKPRSAFCNACSLLPQLSFMLNFVRRYFTPIAIIHENFGQI